MTTTFPTSVDVWPTQPQIAAAQLDDNLAHAGLHSEFLTKITGALSALEKRSFGNIFFPWEHGATGDGSTIDGPAIQASLNDAEAAGGGIVVLPPPSVAYQINSTLNVASNVWLVGYGYNSLIRSAVAGTFAFVKNKGWATSTAASNVQIRGLRFRRTNTLASDEGPYDGGVVLRLVDSATVEDCIFESSIGGVLLEGCTRSVVRNCRGYSQGDCSFRLVDYGTPSFGVNSWGTKIENCTSFNAGYTLDGTTAVTSIVGAIGSAFLSTQNGSRIVDCTVVNARTLGIELGPLADGSTPSTGITIDGFTSINTIAPSGIHGRGGGISIKDTAYATVLNTRIECHLNAQAPIFCTSIVNQPTDVIIDGVSYLNDYASNGVDNKAIDTGGALRATVRNVYAIGGHVRGGATGSPVDHTFENCEVRLARQRGFYMATVVRLIMRNCRALDCGNDTSVSADYTRAGFMFDSIGAGGVVEECVSIETRAGGSRTQLYGFGSNGTSLTISWNNNYTDSNNVTGKYSTTGGVTLAGRHDALIGYGFPTKAGAFSDADFAATPPDGTAGINTSASTLMVRIGGTWKSTAALT